MLNTLIKALVAGIFCSYWLATICYNLPDNYIKAKNQETFFHFSLLFKQSWKFFAPPPRSNHYLYFNYFSNSRKMRTIEVIEHLSEAKRKNLPFNSREEILDYIVGGCLGVLNSDIVYRVKEMTLNKDSELSLQELSNKIRADINNDKEGLFYYKILKNLALEVANENFNATEKNLINEVQIVITEKNIPKFIDRRKESQEKEIIVIAFDRTKY